MENKNQSFRQSDPSLARRKGVLMEDLDAKLDLVLEGHDAIDKKIETLKQEMNERFESADFKLDVVLEEVMGVQGKLTKLRGDVEKKVDRSELELIPSGS